MERPGLLQSVGWALLLGFGAVAGGRTAATRQAAAEPLRVVVAGAGGAAAAAPHLDGAALIRAFLQRDSLPVGKLALRVLVFTLPDPISSHLDWSYDAELESMRRAMEHSGYVIDRFWLPWRASGDTAAARQGIADSLPAARWPGVMLFRRGNTREDSLCLVYVVGEVPTSGIHPLAMREALLERRRLLPVDSTARGVDTLRVVGPAFSGSSLSLRRALAAWRATVRDEPVIEIVSGSASDATNLQTLTDTAMRMQFHATVHTSGWLAAAALKVITKRLAIAPEELAFLHEGTTQFGNSAGSDSVAAKLDTSAAPGRSPRKVTPPVTKRSPSKLPLEISFPMSISGLRVQYARNPERQAADPAGGAPPAAPRLALDQREPASLSESPAVLSQLTAPSTELLLAQIERSLLAHHIRAVGILATDVRDELFLADEIRKRLPDVQLFFYGSNVLRLRPDFQKAVRGSLVVSTYPLVTENQYWDLTKSNRERLVFTGDESEGVFNATLYQLDRRAELMDYAQPLSQVSSHGPPTWLTVVGRDAMYPVALIDDLSPRVTDAENRYLALRSANSVRDTSETTWRALQFPLLLFLLLLGFVASFVALQRRTSRRVKAVTAFPIETLGRGAARRGGMGDERERALRWASLLLHREMYVLLRHFSLFAAYSCALLLLFRPQAHGIASTQWMLWVVGAVAAVLTAVVFWRAVVQSGEVLFIGRKHRVRLFHNGLYPKRRDRLLSRVELVARLTIFAIGLGYFALTLLFLGEVLSLPTVSATLFFHRAVAVTGGVSPAVPLVLAAIGFAAWCTWHLTRISLLAEPTVFEEFLLRQAESESTRRVATRFVMSMQLDAEREAREALAWSSQAIEALFRERKSEIAVRLPAGAAGGAAPAHGDGNGGGQAGNGGSGNGGADYGEDADDDGWRWFRVAPMSATDMLHRAEVSANATTELLRRADAEMKRARDETPTYVWRTERPLQLETREIRRAAEKARADVAHAREVFAKATAAKESRRAARAAGRNGVMTRIVALGEALADGAGRTLEVASAVIDRIAAVPALRRPIVTATRSVNGFADWYERSSTDDQTVRRAPSAAKEVSDALFYLVPNGLALAVLAGGIALACWLAAEFELSLESLVLAPHAWLGGATSFDVLFRFGILTLAGVTAWAVYRLAVVWSGIRRVLEEIPADLVPSFVALPPKLARVAHLTLFGHASASEIQEVVDEAAKRMDVATDELPADFRGQVEQELGRIRRLPAPSPRARPYQLDATSYQEFDRLHRAVELCRRSKLLADGKSAPAADAAGDAVQKAKVTWARSVADLYVVFVADYVDWVFQHMRYLASFLLVCLVVMIVLLASYPFQPRSALQVVHTFILIVAVATLMYVIVQMNRQTIVSAIANTTPGDVSWNSRFVGALVTYGALPLLTLLSTEFPAIRDFLFAWVAPLVRSLGKG